MSKVLCCVRGDFDRSSEGSPSWDVDVAADAVSVQALSSCNCYLKTLDPLLNVLCISCFENVRLIVRKYLECRWNASSTLSYHLHSLDVAYRLLLK